MIAADVGGHEKTTITYGLYASGSEQKLDAISKVGYPAPLNTPQDAATAVSVCTQLCHALDAILWVTLANQLNSKTSAARNPAASDSLSNEEKLAGIDPLANPSTNSL